MLPSLGIIVPYRDRADHLDEFLFEATRFFAADPINAGISPRFLIVEQAPGLSFNRGALKNVGFRLLEPHRDGTFRSLPHVDLGSIIRTPAIHLACAGEQAVAAVVEIDELR
jgi:hypothetical protein